MLNDAKLRAKWIKSLGYFSIIIGDLVGFCGLGVALGYWLWKKWNAPIWTLPLTSSLGLGIAMYRLYKMMQKEVDETDRENGDR